MIKDDKLYKETVEAQSGIVLKYIGKRIGENKAAEFNALQETLAGIEIPEELDKKLRNMAIGADRERERKRRQAKFKQMCRVCAMVLVAVVLAGAVTIGSVDALRVRFLDFVFQHNQDFIVATPVGPEDAPATGIPEEWSGYWYPDYLPEGYTVSFTEEMSFRKRIVFQGKDDLEQLTFIQSSEEGQLYIDNESGSWGETKIKDVNGHWFAVEQGLLLIWIQDNCAFRLMGDFELEELVRIAESISYRR